MKLSLQYNEHSDEALKHVYALLFADNSIVVEINIPTVTNVNLQNLSK